MKAFAMEKLEVSRFMKENLKYFRLIFQQAKLRNVITPVNDMIGVFLGVFLLWIGGREVLETGTMDPDSFIRFIIYLFAMLQPARQLGNVNAIIQGGLASAERVFTVLDVKSDIVDPSSPVALNEFSKEIKFENVSFRYENTDKASIRDINIAIAQGEILALVGSSGAGKSTFADLIPRFYDVTKGKISIEESDAILSRVHWTSEIESIAASLINSKMDGVIATNTTLSRDAVQGLKHADEMGGLSGSVMTDMSLEVTRKLNKALDRAIPIIGVGGIDSPKAAQARLDAGASLVQVYSAFIYQGPSLVKRIVNAL